VLVFVFWFIWYVWIYAFLVYEPSLVTKLGLSLPSVDWYSGVSFLAFPLGALIALRFADRIPRIAGIAVSCVVAIAGAVVLATAQDLTMVIVGAALVGLGNNAGVGLAYAYTAELFPTRARASAMSIGDGVGHLGGALQVYMTLPILNALGARWAFGFIGLCLFVNLGLVVLTRRRTVGQSLTEIAA
jgi:putative MFS transporter